MENKKGFKAVATILITGIFGYLGYLLYDGVASNVLYTGEGNSAIIQLAVILGPLVVSIILGWIYGVKIWIGSLLTILVCTGINSILGEDITQTHVVLFAICLILPYILCLTVIISDGFSKATSEDTLSNSPNYSGSSSSTSSGINTYMTIRGTNDPVYYKNGEYVDSSGNRVPLTEIDD